jgi:hypothetical protein
MIFKSLSRTVFVCAVSCAALAAQVIDPVPTYPYLTVSPAAPVAGADSVVLKLSLGTAGNSCMAPTFTGLSFTVIQSPLAIYPPVYNVTLTYTLVPVPPNKMCPMIYAPVDYGPSFALGKLSLGSYTVTDKTTGKQVGAFSVVNSRLALKDTVSVTPAKPSAKDSLHFDLFNANLSCCAQYYSKTVTVTDSVITLSYEYRENPACACLVAGSHTAFACGPQKAGKYAIYKEQGIYCPPGQVCPLAPIQIVRVGEVSVSGTAVAHAPSNAPNVAAFEVRGTKNMLFAEYSLDRPAIVRLNVFNSRGLLVGQIYNGEIGAGRHDFSWKASVQGVYVIPVEINGMRTMTRTVILTR